MPAILAILFFYLAQFFLTEPNRAMKAPRRSLGQWGGFVHLLARFYMNYPAAVMRAAKRKGHRKRVDIDTQKSRQGTPWALHWGNLKKNKLHDPTGHYKPSTRIAALSDAELARMKYPNGKHPQPLVDLLHLAHDHGVGVEVELKSLVSQEQLEHLMADPKVAAMHAAGASHLLFKTLAAIGGAPERLAEAHRAGGTTVLTFTKYHGKGISKRAAWPVTDFVRGKPKWTA